MIKILDGLLDRFFAACGGFILSQAPAFMQQYVHRLGGDVSELKLHLATVEKVAAESGKNLDQYIEKFVSNPDVDFHNQGMILKKMADRFQDLSTTLQMMENASIFNKPYVFFSHFQSDIVYETYKNFSFSINLTLESFIYIIIGIAFG